VFEPAKSPGVAEWRGRPVLDNHGQRRVRRHRHGSVEVADLMLYGRDLERSAITALLDGTRAARGGALVLRGRAGAGKSALLDDAVAAAAGMRVLRAAGVESEFELPFAALHQLLRPVLDHIERLPVPQAAALGAAFGLVENDQDSRSLVSIAVLRMLDELARESPVLCVIDDAQWLDDASASALEFVARRIDADQIALLFAARDGDVRRFSKPGLAELHVNGLDAEAGGELLAERVGVPIPPEVLSRLLEATGGNPLALVELPSVITPGQFSGREPLPWPLPLTDAVQRIFVQRARRLPEHTQRLLLVAAADETSRLTMVLAAASELDVPAAALDPAERAELVEIQSGQLAFRHPLVRSSIYQSATDAERRRAHRALSDVLVDEADADRRAWHLALAAVQPDEFVVRQLEQTAVRAQRRGGFEAACTALERAAQLTAEPEARAGRLAAAGQSAWQAGQLVRAAGLLQEARQLTTDPILGADVDQLRGWIELSVGSAVMARRLLTDAAKEIADLDPQRALEMLAAAAEAAWIAGDNEAGAELGQAAARLPPADTLRARFLTHLLNGFVGLLNGDVARPVRALHDAMDLGAAPDPDLVVRAGHVAFYLGDDDAAYRLNAQTAGLARTTGAIGELQFALQRLALAEITTGRWAAAEVSADEAERLSRETSQPGLSAVSLGWLVVLAVLTGDEERFQSLAGTIEKLTSTHALGVFDAQVRDALHWARGLRELTAGNPESAATWFAAMSHPAVAGMAAALDRIEAAIHAGRRDEALEWLGRLDAFATHTGIASEQARVAHCRALLAEGETARSLFEEALTLHSQSRRPFERARTELAYGEFLRRSRRRVEARTHLQAALDRFEQLNAHPWAERARQELRAAGRTARKRDPSTVLQLTPQEIQVARFVARGLHTREVAAQLFLSTRTVDFHLRNVFAKLGISSRTELARFPWD
jgi:DNA-binding CsgD family transcriptional regulator